MNIREFLRELMFFFPIERKLDEEQTTRILEIYVDDILYALENYPEHNCDYKRLLQEIRITYEYKKFPAIADILKQIPKALVRKSLTPRYSGREGKIIKKCINGIEYAFTFVPNHWEKIKTEQQIDYLINERIKK